MSIPGRRWEKRPLSDAHRANVRMLLRLRSATRLALVLRCAPETVLGIEAGTAYRENVAFRLELAIDKEMGARAAAAKAAKLDGIRV